MGDDLDSVGEHHTCDQLWQLVVAVEAAPTFLRGLDALEDHRERGLVREAALLQVKDPQELFMLQTEFIRAQMQAMAEQAKDLSETATKPMMGSVKTPTKGGLSS